MEIDKKIIRKWLALIALIIFGVFIIYFLSNFINPFLGAIIFYVLFKPMMNKLVDRYKWSQSWGALLIILLSFFIILIPIITLSYLLYAKISDVLNDPTSLVNIINMFSDNLKAIVGVDLMSDENMNTLKKNAGNLIPSFLNQFVWTLGNIAIMYFMLYYLLVQRKSVSTEMHSLLPFDNENIKILTSELESMTMSNIIGVPAIAIIQGTVAGIGYWFFGLNEPVFWAVITGFVSLLPLIGSTLIWAPAGLFLIANGNTWPGIGLLVYGVIVIINIDNVARFIIQKRFADVHPVITVFGVIIGLNLFGLPGLIFGPLMLSYFVIFVKMYRKIYAPPPTLED